MQYIVPVEHFESANLYGNEKFQVECFATVNTYAMCINGECTEYDADDIVCGGFPGHANSETDEACGVEANILFIQSQFSPS